MRPLPREGRRDVATSLCRILRREQFGEGLFHFSDIESTRPLIAAVGDRFLGGEDEEPVGVTAECLGDRILHVVEQNGNLESDGRGARGGGFAPVLESLVLLDVDVSGRTGTVGGVGFLGVDPVEVGFVLICFVDFLQAPGLPREGASGIRAEDQDGEAFGFGEFYGEVAVRTGSGDLGNGSAFLGGSVDAFLSLIPLSGSSSKGSEESDSKDGGKFGH